MKRLKYESQGLDSLVEPDATRPLNRPRARKGGLSLLPTISLDVLFEVSVFLAVFIHISSFTATDFRLSETT
jgi:hypothetical protein